jgi:hypothetical protein
MGKKLLVSLAMEGKLQAEGLQAIDEDDDLLTAMARELVTRQGVGERAAEVWKTIQIQQSELSQSRGPTAPEVEATQVDEPDSDDPGNWIQSDSPAVQLSLF